MLDLQDDFLHFNHLISNIASEKLMSRVFWFESQKQAPIFYPYNKPKIQNIWIF
jgi:hypothetical protein